MATYHQISFNAHIPASFDKAILLLLTSPLNYSSVVSCELHNYISDRPTVPIITCARTRDRLLPGYENVIYLYKGMVASSASTVAQIESIASSSKYFSVLFSRK